MRHTLSTLVTAAGLSLAAISVGAAADLGARPVYKAPPMVAPAFSWTGFYIGANAGYGWGDESSTLAPSGDAASQAFWNPSFAAGAAPSAFGYSPNGFIGGGQIGYNYQFSPNWVAGLEADFMGASISGSQAINTNVVGFFPGSFTSSQKLDFLGTVRGRIGFTPADRWLAYVTGGLAYGDVQYNLNFAFPGSNDFHSINTSSTNIGWTIGGGLEWAIWQNWSLRAEYLYVDLGNQTFTSVPSGRAANLATTLTETFENKYNIVRAAVNFRF